MSVSTRVGYVNTNGQEVLGATGQAGSDNLQKIYVMKCRACSSEYRANGSDIAGRLCPVCGGGRPEFSDSAADIRGPSPSDAERTQRNPNWTRDELILALDVYFDVPSPDQHHPIVAELSALLNRFWAASDSGGGSTLRNFSGVSMKLSNFQRFDPRFQERGRKGLTNGGRLEEEVWQEFANDRPRLHATALAIRAVLDQTPSVASPISDANEDFEAAEGTVLTRLHQYRERDRGLARRRKEKALADHGRLQCEACDFDFAEAYGERGLGYMEVHHTRPLETLQPGARTRLSELAVLCANCHRMVHARRPWLTVDELRAVVAVSGARRG